VKAKCFGFSFQDVCGTLALSSFLFLACLGLSYLFISILKSAYINDIIVYVYLYCLRMISQLVCCQHKQSHSIGFNYFSFKSSHSYSLL